MPTRLIFVRFPSSYRRGFEGAIDRASRRHWKVTKPPYALEKGRRKTFADSPLQVISRDGDGRQMRTRGILRILPMYRDPLPLILTNLPAATRVYNDTHFQLLAAGLTKFPERSDHRSTEIFE